MLITLLAFALTIFIIVAIHEYGHYLTMRLFGVRVLTFSIGFGPRLARWRAQNGTEFVLSAIPLGGYVKPLDRRDCDILPGEEQQEFSGKPAWQRVLVYAAGPAANLLLAVLLYWVVLVVGQTGLPPVVGPIAAQSAAANAGLQPGDEILALDGRRIRSWDQFGNAMLHYVGETRSVPVTVARGQQEQLELALPVAAWSRDPEQPLLEALGLSVAPLAAVVGKVHQGSAAEQAGLLPGDRLLTLNGTPVAGWRQWVEQVQQSAGQTLQLEVQRGDQRVVLTLVPAMVSADGQQIGRAGVELGGLRDIRYGVLEAIPAAVSRLGQQISMIVGSIVKMLAGDISVKSLGGPITIAQAAGETAAIGVVTFMTFLAFFSISLGVINLLPVPMLDGGWILFGLVEMMRGKALPERFLMMAQSVGLILVVSLMGVAIFNDLMRQFA